MQNIKLVYNMLKSIVIIFWLITFVPSHSIGQATINFWNQQRKGTNCPNNKVDKNYW